MKYYINNCTDPHYNLALEEYIFENATDDVFMLWRNQKSVIIGKNQNAYSEVNLNYTKQNSISVVRRITGGGAVFHDIGNINYTFISPNATKEKDFRYFSMPIIEALGSLGVETSFSGRNDLVSADGRKISGTARCEKNGRVMHHGTLLYCADMTDLSKALNVNPEKVKSKGVRSVKSRVANISSLLKYDLSPLEFMERIRQFVVKLYDCQPLLLKEDDIEAVNKLKSQKYDTEKWNLSLNLPFEKSETKYFSFGLVTVKHTVKNGIIENIHFEGDFFGTKDISLLEALLINAPYREDEINDILQSCNISDFIAGAKSENILNLIFN